MGRRKPAMCLHPAGEDRGGLLGEEAFLGCPALKISDLSRALYEIHILAHSAQPGTYHRHLDYTELVKMPCIVAEAFNVVADETNRLIKESNASGTPRPDSSDQAQRPV